MGNNDKKSTQYSDGLGNDVNPWYREPWPWFVFGIPAVTVVASFALLYIAITNQPEVLTRQSPSVRKAAVLEFNAQEKQINAQVKLTDDNRVAIRLNSKANLSDKALSVAMVEINDEKSPSNKRSLSDSTIYLELEQESKIDSMYFVANKMINNEQAQKSYWLEIIGYKGAWTLHGILTPQGFTSKNK